MKLLGPWPILQFMFGIAVLSGGVWMIIRGTQKKDEPKSLPSPQQLEDIKNLWRAYERLENIEQNTFKEVELLSRILDRLNNNADQMKGLAAAIWNRKEGV